MLCACHFFVDHGRAIFFRMDGAGFKTVHQPALFIGLSLLSGQLQLTNWWSGEGSGQRFSQPEAEPVGLLIATDRSELAPLGGHAVFRCATRSCPARF